MIFKTKDFKAAALKQLKNHWKMPVVITLVAYSIIFVLMGALFPWKWYINVIREAVHHSTVLDSYGHPLQALIRIWITTLVLMLVQPIILFALKSIFPKLYKGEEPVKFSDFIAGLSLWPKGLGSYWWQYLWLYLWMLAGAVPGFIVAVVFGVLSAVLHWETTLVMAIIPIIIYAGILTVLIIKAYQYYVQYFILVDNLDIKVIDSLKISKALTKGYKWKLFCMDLSFLGWSILCLIWPIGFLWLMPYQLLTEFNAFKFLLDEYNKKMESKEKPAEIEQNTAIENKETVSENNSAE